jgi:hypothetical protein
MLLLISLLASGLDLSAAREKLNALGVVLLAALGLLALLLLLASHVGAVRYTQTGKGLFDPPGNLRVLFGRGTRTAKLIGSFVLLSLFAVVGTAAGGALLVLPGLFVSVVCAIVWWRLLAAFVTEVS